MKKKMFFAIVVIGIFLGGGAIGYAASIGFDSLESIRENFNTVLQYGKTKAQRVTDLESELSQNGIEQNRLKEEIEQIKKDKEDAVNAKQGEINAKQQEINAKQEEVNAKQQEADALRTKLDSMKSEKEQLEQKINELKRYTDQKVSELPK